MTRQIGPKVVKADVLDGLVHEQVKASSFEKDRLTAK